MLLPLFLLACRPSITVTDPAPGAMLEAGADVAVGVETGGNAVEVDGAEAQGEGGRFETTVAPADGLGFLVATVPGTQAQAVRSWHQGEFLDTDQWQPQSMAVRLGADLLDDPVGELARDLLEGEELVDFVDNPIDVAGVGDLTVESVVAPQVAIALEVEESGLAVEATLAEVLATYSADVSFYSTHGTAFFESIVVRGTVAVSTDGAVLEDESVEATDPEVEDEGGLPSYLVDAVVQALEPEIHDTISEAAGTATTTVVGQLALQLSPSIGIDFAAPITHEARLASMTPDGEDPVFVYDSLVAAQDPALAQEGQGVLQRSADLDQEGDLVACVGAPLVNPLAFAAWDAGNLEGYAWTLDELVALGMPEPTGAYARLETATLSLDLPPLLEWDDSGPWLVLGGIRTDVTARNLDDTVARCAARVPVSLALEADGALHLAVDGDRTLELEEVGFDQLNKLADPERVNELLQAAVPGVVEDVFADLPAVSVPELALTDLWGDPGPAVTLAFLEVHTLEAGWCVAVEMEVDVE